MPLATANRHSGRSGPGRHPVSSSTSRAAATSGDSPTSTRPGGDLPAPGVGDEPVPPQQQHAPLGIAHEGAGGVRRRAQHVVLEALAARRLDVDEAQLHPVALVQRSFAVHRPPHGRSFAEPAGRQLGRQRPPAAATIGAVNARATASAAGAVRWMPSGRAPLTP